MKLTTIYRSIIESVDKIITEDDAVVQYSHARDCNVPVTLEVDGKKLPLHLPTDKILGQRDQTNYVGFHPLSESHLRGESAVNVWLRRAIAATITNKVAPLVIELIEAATTESVSQSAEPKHLDLLKATKGADAKTVEQLTAAILKIDNVKNVLCNIFIKRDGETLTSGKPTVYDRACIVRFPIPMDDPSKLFGVTLRKSKVKDLEILDNVLNLILPDWQSDAYCAGSNAKEAPYFKSLLLAYFKVANAYNRCVLKHKDIIEDYEEQLINTEWYEHVADLDSYSNEITPLQGNIGTTSGNKENAPARGHTRSIVHVEEIPVTSTEAVPEPEQYTQQPQSQHVPEYERSSMNRPVAHTNYASNPTPAPSTGGVSMSDRLKAASANHAPAPQYQHPSQAPAHYPAPQYQQQHVPAYPSTGYSHQPASRPSGYMSAAGRQQPGYGQPQQQAPMTAREKREFMRNNPNYGHAPQYYR